MTFYHSFCIRLNHWLSVQGQAYVALSRATSMDGLQVLNFSADKVKAFFDSHCIQTDPPLQVFVHEKVRAWSNTLETLTS